MDVIHYVEEIEKYIDSFRLQIEEEKKEIINSQKKFSSITKALTQKAPSTSILTSLFKDEEPDVFNFSKYEEKRKQLAEQRRAEYNAYLEKKEKELDTKRLVKTGRQTASPKSILDSVDYEQVLAKRKEEEAQFRNVNHADVLHSTKPILKENKPVINAVENSHTVISKSLKALSPSILPASITHEDNLTSKLLLEEQRKKLAALEAENARLLEERIAKQLAEQRQQMLQEFENELRKNNQIREEIEKLQSATTSVNNSPRRTTPKAETLPKFGRTGGGGEPVRDSFGNLITLRGFKKENADDQLNIMYLPSMQQQPIKDRMALYREELQKQIEEKKRLEALEKDKAKKAEEKMALRSEEQRLAMQREYEKELERNNKIKEEFQRQQERIRMLEEFQKKDANERRKKLAARPPETENIPPNVIVPERSQSPPIPAVRTKVLLEKAVTAPAPEIKPENVFSSLAEIRRKIKQEQQKPKKENSYEVMNRRTVQEISDDEDDDFLQSSFKYSD